MYGKFFMKILKERINSQYKFNQSKKQAGFRKNYATTNHIFVINQLIERTRENSLSIKLIRIDFNKAFDSVGHQNLWDGLRIQGFDINIIEIVKMMYENSRAYIKIDKRGREFQISRGVRQGINSPQSYSTAY